MVKSGSSLPTISDLAGLKLGVQISSAAEDAVNVNPIVNYLGELVKFDTYNSALLELQNGTIDTVVIYEIMGRYIMSQNEGEYEALDEDFGKEEYGIGFRLEADALRDEINRILNEMVEDGKTAEISTNWFDEDIFLS